MLKSRTFLVLLLIPVGLARGQQRDLREEYGTKSLEAAKLVHQASENLKARKAKLALEAADSAIKEEPTCQTAYFIKALALNDLGDVEKAIETYKFMLSDKVVPRPRVSAQAANNLAITYAKLKEFDDANLWFTRAILEDPINRFAQRGKAYRNMAITLRGQGKHLAAALSLAFALEDRAPNITPKMLRDYFDKAEGQEAASLMHFPDPLPKPGKRAQEAKLTPAALENGPADSVAELLPDPQGRYVVALTAKDAHYYLIATDAKLAARKIEIDKPLRCACLAEGHLYAVREGPARIDKIEPASGKVVTTYSLGTHLPASLAVFPSQGRAFFPAERVVHQLDLTSGSVVKTDIPGHGVAGDPSQRFVYSWIKPENRRDGVTVIIGGRPVRLRTGEFDWLQTSLYKAVLVPNGLLLAEARANAASNGARMSLSPDGNWVAVAGGGGWRPAVKQDAAGYGVAVFCGHRLDQLQGFFATDAYPNGVCFNPVTAQVAVVREQDAKVYHLGDPKSRVELTGKFSGVGAWSGNGRYLLLATAKGLSAYENALSIDEEKIASTWWKAIKLPVAAKPATAVIRVVEEYTRFSLTAPDRKEVAKALARALETGRTERPARWEAYAPYVKDEAPRKAIAEAQPQIEKKDDLGIVIFQIKKALKSHADSVPLQFVLADAYRLNEQGEEAEKLYQAVVRADAGRTELTCNSLNHLATLLDARNEGLAAVHCLAASLFLDRANARTLAQAIPLLKKHKFEAEAEKLAKSSTVPNVVVAELPKLAPSGELKKMTPADIYRRAVVSVVLIKTSKGSGSGICVGRPDIILTNSHVVEGDGPIEVYSFTVKDKETTRMPKVSASIIFRSAREDVAVLKLEKAPEHLQPLPVASANPSPGDKVYAIGSPGLGEQTLEQTISQGLVSSTNRKLEGVPYLQHSAAVNPGNSGGALLDEGCRVVGLVTLKARLENVSFALPAETIRTLFNSR